MNFSIFKIKNKKNESLEDIIIRFTDKSLSLLETNPQSGLRYLRQAYRLYKTLNYQPSSLDNKYIEIDSKISKSLLNYLGKYL